ncbi:MAG: hypothetical protein ING19_06775 [Azospirillum sp.]|nr:hypothetical protein [Azospirillum sp.]
MKSRKILDDGADRDRHRNPVAAARPFYPCPEGVFASFRQEKGLGDDTLRRRIEAADRIDLSADRMRMRFPKMLRSASPTDAQCDFVEIDVVIRFESENAVRFRRLLGDPLQLPDDGARMIVEISDAEFSEPIGISLPLRQFFQRRDVFAARFDIERAMRQCLHDGFLDGDPLLGVERRLARKLEDADARMHVAGLPIFGDFMSAVIRNAFQKIAGTAQIFFRNLADFILELETRHFSDPSAAAVSVVCTTFSKKP